MEKPPTRLGGGRISKRWEWPQAAWMKLIDKVNKPLNDQKCESVVERWNPIDEKEDEIVGMM
jgi:hypothetical protein